ncbi:unnamed protein product [Miscanthus lutarioriparius]|uniref:BED-type domain-containing protein n=1 Tax=Miscanthus lutarioriparius TaxID=422564 RepID=A0A811QED6_9POAL|nr:unnamed protein product [Miscanthus lutarioriparius]
MTNTQLSGVLSTAPVRERDACWEYCDKLDGNKVRCRFCHKVLNGGICRLKFHLSQIPSKGVNPCTKVKEDVIDKVKAIISAKEEYKEFQLLKRQRVAELKQEVIFGLRFQKPFGINQHSRKGTPQTLNLPTNSATNTNQNTGGKSLDPAIQRVEN